MKSSIKKYNLLALTIFSFFTILCFWICITEKGSGLAGDSLKHFLIAKHAPEQPMLFFNHWGKPFFTLLAMPFAYFGFTGMKVFNVLLALITSVITYKVALLQKQKNTYLVILFLLGFSYYFIKMFGGLTEYLSALLLILAVYLELKEKSNVAAFIISFTPFVRSEGLIIIGVFAFFYLLNKKHKALLYLSAGHVIYSFVGFFWHKDLLWIFTKIPYAHVSSIYGQGNYSHFFNQMMYIVGIPGLILLSLGLISYVFNFLSSREKSNYFKSNYSILVVGLSVAFFTAHTLFWALGIFNSMGLNRVFITIMPLFALMSLMGFNFVTSLFYKSVINKVVFAVLIGYTLVFPFTSNKTSIAHSMKDLALNDVHSNFESHVKPKIDFDEYTMVYASDPYFSYSLNYNLMDTTVCSRLDSLSLERLPQEKNTVVIWDSWFSPVENNCELEDLEDNSLLDKVFELKNAENKVTIAVFETKK